MNSKLNINVVLIGVFVLAGIWLNSKPATAPVQPDVPVVVVTDDLVELKAVVAAGDAKAVKQLGAMYSAMADVLSRDTATLDTSTLRSWLTSSDTYLIQGTDMVGAVPGFGAAKDELFKDLLGLDIRPITPAEKQEVIALCESIAAACGVK